LDLGIKGRTALVCGASKGLGRGCALALAQAKVNVFIVARNAGPMEETVRVISEQTGSYVAGVVADVTTPEGRARALEACPAPDILVTNAAGPPPGDFRDWTRENWIAAIDANMLAPIELIKSTIDSMIAEKFGRIINITSSAVKVPIDVLGLSNGARTGLTGFVAGLSRKTAVHNVTINNLLPGSFDTDRLIGITQMLAKTRSQPIDKVRDDLIAAVPAGRFGDPDEFGAACAFLASAKAGFITGQNLLLDGGAFPGTF
jgi:3-oxoacyl-[acyl-carrier protein] reductase